LFRRAIWAKTQEYCEFAMPERARCFALALSTTFSGINPFDKQRYSLADI